MRISRGTKRMGKRWIKKLAYIFPIVFMCAGYVKAEGDIGRIRFKDHVLSVEIADEMEEKVRGLQKRESLDNEWGMLFVYTREQELCFWMKNTYMPLDIAFINDHNVIVDMQTMEPQTTEIHRSQSHARYALEVNQGWFASHGVEVGDSVVLEGIKK